MKEVTPAMLNKEAQKILTKADPYINRMAELGREPSAVSLYAKDYLKVAKAIEAVVMREKIKGYSLNRFRYRGLAVKRAEA